MESGKWKVESGEANCGDLIGVPNALSRLLDQLYLFIFFISYLFQIYANQSLTCMILSLIFLCVKEIHVEVRRPLWPYMQPPQGRFNWK